MKTCGRGGICLDLPVLLKGTGKIKFKLRPCFVRGRAALPNSTFFGKDARLEYQLVRHVEYLNGGVRCSACISGIYGVLNLTKLAFNGRLMSNCAVGLFLLLDRSAMDMPEYKA